MNLTKLMFETAQSVSEVEADAEGNSRLPALEARDLWFAYDKSRPVLKGVNLTAARGEVTMILGLSGGGKTTLLKLAKGLLTAKRGSISVLGQPIQSATGRTSRLDPRTAYIPQQLGLVRNLTALENALTGALFRTSAIRSLLKLFPRDTVEEARRTLESLGLGHKAEEKVYALSGGERQRVAIARALMQRPGLILADEFVSQLDPVTSAEIMEIMRETARRGVALVMTTHHLEIVSRYADRVVLLRDGEKVMDHTGADADIEELRQRMRI